MRQLAGGVMATYAFLLLWVWSPNIFGVNNLPTAEKAKSRLEELFLWKISDNLSLSTNEEEQFRQNFKRLNEKKSKASQDLDRLMGELEKPQDKKALSQRLEEYSKSLSSYNNVQIEEAKIMRKTLGDKRFAQYLVLKRDLNQKLKNMLSSPSRPESNSPKD